jgi:hypothetical protein
MPAVCVEAQVPRAVAPDEAASIHDAFERYRAALLKMNGELAAEQVSSSTIRLYQEMLDHALKSNRNTVQQLPISSRLMVVLMRHRIAPAELREMNGRSVFIHGVKNKWISERSVNRLDFTLDQVDVSRDATTAEVFPGGRDSQAKLSFIKEQGKWRFDLVPMMAITDGLLRATARNAEMDENAFMLKILEMTTGREVDESIWNPIDAERTATRTRGLIRAN